ncbi:AfsR/SARP family transcriptional regulator [Nocardia neocaledoniensis]|uniref:AfsR/SARP family transcriptional regulator n=1 Tax=Nocardia neocaledoniensis TaxID=236511 RepID=UPI002453EA5B|nr:BTAD domain-containing putative transcriptional regulator [Nocardia neocaledoniensis]
MLFGVLGPIEVRTARGDPVRVPERKVRILLAHLLAQAKAPVSVDRLIEELWRDRPPADPKGALQAKVSQLRRVLEEAQPGGRDLVIFDSAGYRIQPGRLALDTDRFTDLLARARAERAPRPRAALLDNALALWRGPAFADIADAVTVRPAIDRLDDQRLAAFEDRAETQLELGEHELVAGEIARIAAEHPLRERLRAVQMRALYRCGRAGEALAVFEHLRNQLRTELGADPGPELVELHRELLVHSPRLLVEAPERTEARSALPAPPTELVGRHVDTDRVCALLGRCRLVTLIGIGGVGKTRLALAVAQELDRRRPSVTWFVELDRLPATGAAATASAITAVAEAACAALGVRATAGAAEPVTMLAESLRDREGLLVLDNCEHVIGAAARLVTGLLAAAPGLTVLATSREPLELAGETVHPVQPLPVDGAAIELFTARAVAADPDLVVDGTTAAVIRAICLRLDGIPLALELAAARVRSFGPAGLAARLDDRFRVLGTRRGGPERQQTLRATIDWSWDLLTEPERLVLRRLSVFAGGATPAAAEQVCGGAGIGEGEVIDIVAGLVDRSLVARTAEGRFRLLDSVAHYAAERLSEAGESEQFRDRHVAYHLELAETAQPHLRGREQRTWLLRLDAEDPNLRAALCTASSTQGLRLVAALSWYWFLRGRPRIAIDAADAMLAEPGGADWLRADVLVWRTGLALWSRDPGAATDRGVAALAAVPPRSPRRAHAYWLLSFAHWGFGRIAAGGGGGGNPPPRRRAPPAPGGLGFCVLKIYFCW